MFVTTLKKEMDKAKLSAFSLAKKADLTPTRVKQLIHGEGDEMKPSEAFKLADVLEVSALYLLGIDHRGQ